MNGLCSRLTFSPPPRRTIVFFYPVLDTKWSTCITTQNALFCTSTHGNVYRVGDMVYMHARFFPPHIIVDSGKYLMWHLWCLQIFILTPKCSHSVKLQHLVILVAATELTSCWHQADYTLHTYWNHSFSHFIYILLADLAESSKDLLSQLLSHFYPLEIKQTNHNRESGWHFSLLFFISMAQEGRCQMSVHNYYQAL